MQVQLLVVLHFYYENNTVCERPIDAMTDESAVCATGQGNPADAARIMHRAQGCGICGVGGGGGGGS